MKMFGQQANDLIDGGVLGCCGPGNTGNDELDGGHGRDVLHASDFGNNTLRGGQGADELHGWQGSDTLDGGNGSDVLEAFTGNDTLRGRNGGDRSTEAPASTRSTGVAAATPA
jgi:Ca2+-binding RTX toxin-like protein